VLVTQSQVRLYYKNATADAIGSEHGIKREQLNVLGQRLVPLITRLNRDKQERPAYRHLPYDAQTCERVKALVAEVKDQCENLVVLGIGGSALGNIALQTALSPYMGNLDPSQRSGPRLFVLDNIDPAQLVSFLAWDDGRLDKTIFNVISKGGDTAETLSQFMIVRRMLLEKFGFDGYTERVVVTTDTKEGLLCRIADTDMLRPLEVPNGVGGRFSVLSAVGLFSAAMCGINIDQLLAGAADMDARVSCEDFLSNPAAINAAINYYFYNQGKKISVMMPYSFHLKDLADWYRQLWAESLGKAEDLKGNEVHIGPTPIKALGATDQHSQIQLYREGPNDKLFTFLAVDDFGGDLTIGPAPDCAPELNYLAGRKLSALLNNEKKATEYALLESKRPCLTVIFPEISAYTVGQFIYLYEVTTSFAGALFGINPYDQPAVALGKEATFALMGKQGDGYEKLAQQIRSMTDVDTAYLV
jgi:glucose-6-phosphate isomerase